MALVSNPADYEYPNLPIRRDLLAVLTDWAAEGDIGVSRVLEEILEAALGPQGYYWTAEWQQGERESAEDIRAGNVLIFDNAEALRRYLTEPDA